MHIIVYLHEIYININIDNTCNRKVKDTKRVLFLFSNVTIVIIMMIHHIKKIYNCSGFWFVILILNKSGSIIEYNFCSVVKL